MKFIKEFIKFIEGILLLLVPIMVFYWFLYTINLKVLTPLILILGNLFNPVISIVKLYGNFQMVSNDTTIDFAPLIAAVVVLISSFVFSGLEKFLCILEQKVNQEKIKAKQDEEKKQLELEKIKYLNGLAKNRIAYFVLKFNKKACSSSYLYSNNEDDFSVEKWFEAVINGIFDASVGFKAKRYKELEQNSDRYYFVFYSILDVIKYSSYLFNRIKEVNNEFAKQGMNLSASIACHCSYSEDTAHSDFSITSKILNLGGENEMLVSELFKNKYDILEEEVDLKVISKGVYHIENNQIEIYQVVI
ncbi:MAG: hypothetical protein V2B14_01955 [bacterium]